MSFFKKYICYCIYFVLMSVVQLLEKENKNLKEKKKKKVFCEKGVLKNFAKFT